MSLTDSGQPKLLVYAGPNGSGKSTVTKATKPVGLYVNADEIKKSMGCSDLEAAQLAEATREALLRAGKDFTFETVLSTERNLNLLRAAKAAGYEITAVFVLTKDSSINIARVRKRFAAGGHDVPDDKIVSRYQRSLANLAQLVRIADRTLVMDNSGELPEVICEVQGNSVQICENRFWSKNEILRLLSKREGGACHEEVRMH